MPRIALAGAGWAGRVHALAASVTPGVSVHAVAASTTGGAEELAAAISARPTNADSLPGKADAVVIATPPTAHAPLAVRLLSGGTSVLIEKPLATTLSEADDIIAAAEAGGAAACYAENLVFAPAVDVALGRVARLGSLDHLGVRMSEPTPAWGSHDDVAAVGGVLYDLGAHAVALALVLAGDDAAAAVRARVGSVHRDDGVDDVARVEIRFASDLIAPIDVAWTDGEVEWSAQAASAGGAVRLELQPHVAVDADGEPVALPAATAGTDARVETLGYRAQMEGFAAVVARQGGRVCPAGFGRSVLDLLCAAYQSAGRDGEEVALPFAGPRDRTPMQLWRSA